MSALQVEDVEAGYGASERILKGASIRVERHEIVTLVGPNGAGKSTLLKAVMGLVTTSSGRILLDGKDLARASASERARAGIAFVPQERNVFGSLSIAENLAVSGFLDPAGMAAQRNEMYERYPMLAEKRKAQARTLSGGQRQILAMAMGLMSEPKLILLDEPTAGLSPRAANELFDAIVALNRAGLPILMVEQHAVEALEISTRGYVFVAGRAETEGEGNKLATDPGIRRLFLGG